jgi:phage-related minor tail protein
MDLQHQMEYLQDITKGNQTEISKLVGGSAGLQAYNALMTVGSDGTTKFSQTLDAMKDSSGAAANAFATSQDTISSHMAKVQAALSVMSYKALEDLAPTINAVADAVGKAADFMSQHMDIVLPVLAGLATFFGVVIVAAIGAFIISFGTAGAIVAGVAAGIGAAVAGIIAVVTHWGQISSWLQGEWSGVTGFFSGLWQNLRGGVSDVGNWFKDRWKDATTDVVNSFDWLYSHNYYFKSLTDTVKTATTDAGNFLKSSWKTASTDTVNAWNDLKSKASDLWDEISTPFKNAWSQYIAPPLNSLCIPTHDIRYTYGS